METSFRPVSLEELEERIRHRTKTPITLWDEKVRLSLAGKKKASYRLYRPNNLEVFGEGDFALNAYSKIQQFMTIHWY